jgi:peptidoglycan hydrolase CwlO-like protein
MKKSIMKKPIIAALVALFITACVGAAMFTIGGAALLNKNGTTAANSPAQSVNTVSLNPGQQSDQVAQLQNLVSQYQDREKQYQQREQQLQDQLTQANAQIQSDQQVLQQAQGLVQALQERGIIRIADGRIFLNQ